MARPLAMIPDIDDKKELWKVAVKIHHRWKVTTSSKEHFEMVVVDKNGDNIHVIVPTNLREAFHTTLLEKTTCTISNFQVLRNDLLFKPTSHEFLIKFTGGTTVSDVGKHEIPDKLAYFTPFTDIITGTWQRNLLCDVIGVVEEVGYSSMSGNKPQVNMVLRDLGDNQLHCTLWENYALAFFEYKQKLCDPGLPIVVVLKYSKVKDAGKWPLCVSNTYNVTTISFNEDCLAVAEFLKRLPPSTNRETSLTTASTQSRQWSQHSSGSQLSPADKFLLNATALPLHDIIGLTQDTVCVIVATTTKLIASNNGWCYRACHQCPLPARGDTPPFECRGRHKTECEIWRYKIEVEVEQGNTKGIFVFWDREAAEILEKTAAQMRAIMLEAGITDPLEYPLALDALVGLKKAFKVKWQPQWRNASVQKFLADESLIAKLEISPSADQELTAGDSLSIKRNESVDEDSLLESPLQIKMKDTADEDSLLKRPLQITECEITSSNNPEPATPTMDLKRMSPGAVQVPLTVIKVEEGDLSTSKPKKNPKRGKKNTSV